MTDAKRLGAAFCAGLFFTRGRNVAQDAAKWITVHPNGSGKSKAGKNIEGRHVLIDGESGIVLGGMGGKFTGKSISSISKKAKATPVKKTKTTKAKAAPAKTTAPKKPTVPEGHTKLDGTMRVEKETEKAVLGVFHGKRTWLPKSQVTVKDGVITSASNNIIDEKGWRKFSTARIDTTGGWEWNDRTSANAKRWAETKVNLPSGQMKLDFPIRIKCETDKAFMLDYDDYTTWTADENGEEVFPPLWVPKSQVTASPDKKSVYGMAKWLMKRQKIKSWDDVHKKKRKPKQSATAWIRLGNAGISGWRGDVDR